MFHGVSFNPADRTTRIFIREELDRELKDPNVFSWVDIQAPDIAPMNDVLNRMDIDLVLVSHFDAPEVLPRIVERPDCLAFYLYEIDDPERHLDTSKGLSEIAFARMILVLGADYVLLSSIQTAAANRTSEIARALTVISGILLPLTLISGIYGMNFENMPELKWAYGYFGVLGVMVVVGLTLLLTFVRRGWLGTDRSSRRG